MKFKLLGAKDPALNEYIQRFKEIMESDHKEVQEEADSVIPLYGQIEIARLMSTDIVNAFRSGMPVEQVAKLSADNLRSMIRIHTEIEPYCRAVFDLVSKDESYIRAPGKAALDVILADLTMDRFREGATAEQTASEFCGLLKERLEAVEQEILLNMPIQGTH
jgi:hypothetical protein